MDYKRDINIMPEEQKQQKSNLAATIIFYIIAIGIIISVAGVYMPNAYLKSKIDEKNQLAQEEQRLAEKVSEFDQLQAKSIYLSGKKRAFETLDEGYIRAISIFEEFEKALPRSVTITRFTVNQTQISIEGFAPTNTDIAQLYINLLNSKYFKSVVLNTISTEEETETKHFPMSITIELEEAEETEENEEAEETEAAEEEENTGNDTEQEEGDEQ